MESIFLFQRTLCSIFVLIFISVPVHFYVFVLEVFTYGLKGTRKSECANLKNWFKNDKSPQTYVVASSLYLYSVLCKQCSRTYKYNIYIDVPIFFYLYTCIHLYIAINHNISNFQETTVKIQFLICHVSVLQLLEKWNIGKHKVLVNTSSHYHSLLWNVDLTDIKYARSD